MIRLRTFLTMLALLFAAGAISAPLAARSLHGISHMAAPVMTGQHHHHDDDGAVTEHGSSHESAPQSDDLSPGKFGHSHLASSAFDVVSQIGGDLPPSPILSAEAPALANTLALSTLGWSPQKRPPRAA